MEPVDKKLYSSIKNKIWSNNPVNSAYRSGLLVKTYKQEFKKKYGNREPYGTRGTSKTSKTSRSKTSKNRKSLGPRKFQEPQGLTRWFLEDWRNQYGEIGYRRKSDVYRPTYRITSKTPTTFGELSPRQIEKARREKYYTGRVKKFK